MGISGQIQAPAALKLCGRTPVSIEQDHFWISETVWTFLSREENIFHVGIRTPVTQSIV
jgi:hypothetical protein